MADFSIQDLHAKGSQVIAGEVLTMARSGQPVARLPPPQREDLCMEVIVERWRRLQPMDPGALRRDLDRVIDPSL